MVPCKSTAKEVSFEWSHHRISSTDSKVRTTLHVSITDSVSDRVLTAPEGDERWLYLKSRTVVTAVVLIEGL